MADEIPLKSTLDILERHVRDVTKSVTHIATTALDEHLDVESEKLSQQLLSTLRARYNPLLSDISSLNDISARIAHRLTRLRDGYLNCLYPERDKMFLEGAALGELDFFKFLYGLAGRLDHTVGISIQNIIQIRGDSHNILKALHGKATYGECQAAEESGIRLMQLVQHEFANTIIKFDEFLRDVYMHVKTEYKRMRKQFLGRAAGPIERDPLEDEFMRQMFGMQRQMEPPALNPAQELINNNVMLTQMLMDLAEIVPEYHEHTVPIYKKGVATGKTRTNKIVDQSHVDEAISMFSAASHKHYLQHADSPSDTLAYVLNILKEFHSDYLQFAAIVDRVMEKTQSTNVMSRKGTNFESMAPARIERHFTRINFLGLIPNADDIAPRNRMERDYSIARNKLLLYIADTMQKAVDIRLSNTSWETDVENYLYPRMMELIELKAKVKEVIETEQQRALKRNIQDDNEFYVSKGTGRIGELTLERAAAPKIVYTDVVGASFNKAKEHIEEVVKVASHPHTMRLSAPRGDVRSNLLLIGAYGCHRKGQKIILHCGCLRNVEDIRVGDQLMGPDGSPRNVGTLVRGTDTMYEIAPLKGDPFVVNQNHILSLVKTQRHWKKDSVMHYEATNEIVDVPVNEYVKWFAYKKKFHPLFRAEAIDFPNQWKLPLDPYFLGVLLGDGCLRSRTSVTTADVEIVAEISLQAVKLGLKVSTENWEDNKPAVTYHLNTEYSGGGPNPLREILRDLELFNRDSETKFIPHSYKTASKEERLALLAGLIDTDGSLYGWSCYDYSTKSKQLADDILFVARSLGLAAYAQPCEKGCQTGAIGTYHRIIISGDTAAIPTRIPRKKAALRRQVKNVRRVGFATRELPPEDFFGFVVDGDHRYLLDDFTVVHNCGKSEYAKAVGSDPRIIGVNVATADLLTAYMHESVKNIKRMYDAAADLRKGSRNTKPVGILLDEFDRLFTYGEGVHAAYDGDRMTGTLQEMMDGIMGYEGVFMVALTNLPKRVPEAILRRFKYIDVVGQLTKEERAHLLKQFLSRGLPLHPMIVEEDYLRWAEQLDHAPGDVLGKIADEVHFKFMHEMAVKSPRRVADVERTLAQRLRERPAKPADREYLKKALAGHREIDAIEIDLAIRTVMAQPQIQMQIKKSKEVYKDADEIMAGLSRIDSSGLGFGAQKKSALWGRD